MAVANTDISFVQSMITNWRIHVYYLAQDWGGLHPEIKDDPLEGLWVDIICEDICPILAVLSSLWEFTAPNCNYT